MIAAKLFFVGAAAVAVLAALWRGLRRARARIAARIREH